MPGKKKNKAAETPRDASTGAEPTAEPAADGEVDEDEDEEVVGNKRDGADISKVTDFVEQKELDSAKASKAIASITTEMEVDREAERERERELAAVVIEQVRMSACERRAHASFLPHSLHSSTPRHLSLFATCRRTWS